MAKLKENDILLTTGNEQIKILNELGEGGQGIVYRCLFRNGDYAFKWYAHGAGKNAIPFYKNLVRNVNHGAPADTFLWPIAVTPEDNNGCFGYVMALRPSEYKEFGQFLLNRAKFSGFSAIVNTALLIVASFKRLHNNGLSYQDLNDGNFFINPKDGDLLICDNDNVAQNGDNFGIQGKPKYMAPEVVLLTKQPDTYSDRFSLAVILFMLLFRDHPLDGMLDDDDEIDMEENDMNLYCKNPIFIFDKNDSSNRPKPGVNVNAPVFWNAYPDFVKDIFTRAFSKELMKCDGGPERQNRIMEKEWLNCFIKLRESIIVCPKCHEETFFDSKKDECVCINCGARIAKPVYLSFKNKKIPLFANSKIYKYEIEDSDITVSDIKSVAGLVVENKVHPGVFGIKNFSGSIWYRKTPGGKEVVCENGGAVPIAKDNTIKFGSGLEAKIE